MKGRPQGFEAIHRVVNGAGGGMVLKAKHASHVSIETYLML